MSTAPLVYRIADLRPLSFTERAGWLDLPEPPPLTYAPAFGFTFDPDARLVQIITYLNVYLDLSPQDASDEDEDGRPVAQCEVGCSFEFESLDGARDASGFLRLPRPLMAQLLGIAISSARGVLVGRANHPLFQRAPLPVVSPVLMLDDLLAEADYDWVAPAEPTA